MQNRVFNYSGLRVHGNLWRWYDWGPDFMLSFCFYAWVHEFMKSEATLPCLLMKLTDIHFCDRWKEDFQMLICGNFWLLSSKPQSELACKRPYASQTTCYRHAREFYWSQTDNSAHLCRHTRVFPRWSCDLSLWSWWKTKAVVCRNFTCCGQNSDRQRLTHISPYENWLFAIKTRNKVLPF